MIIGVLRFGGQPADARASPPRVKRAFRGPKSSASSSEPAGLPCIPAHQVDQILQCLALPLIGDRLCGNAVGDWRSLIEKVGDAEPLSALRSVERAPQSNRIDVTDIILEPFDIVDGCRRHAPVILIRLKYRGLVIDQAA